MKNIYEISFKLIGHDVDVQKVLSYINNLSSETQTIKEVKYHVSENLENVYRENWNSFILKKDTETDHEYADRMKSAQKDLRQHLVRDVPNYAHMIMILALHNIDRASIEAALNRKRELTRVRSIKYPGIDMCKEMLNVLASSSNNMGPIEHLESLVTEEDWLKESEDLMRNLECFEYDESFSFLTKYCDFKLEWEPVEETKLFV